MVNQRNLTEMTQRFVKRQSFKFTISRIQCGISNRPVRKRRVMINNDYLRKTKLHKVVPDLFEEHDNAHLQAKINQTAAWMTLREKKHP